MREREREREGGLALCKPSKQSRCCSQLSTGWCCLQVAESHVYVAERFGGWQEAALLFLGSHFRSGASAADFGKLSGALLQHVRDLDSVKVSLATILGVLVGGCI